MIWNLSDFKHLIISGYLSIVPSVDMCLSSIIILYPSVFNLFHRLGGRPRNSGSRTNFSFGMEEDYWWPEES